MAEKREWSNDEVMQLINMYEEHDFLWNVQHSMYRNRDKKKVAFDAFAKQFPNCDGNEVQRKIHNLRNQLSHEMQKVKKCKSGDGTEKRYNSKWKFFTALQFISPSFTPTRTTSNINKTLDNIDIAEDEQTEDGATTIRRKTPCKRTSQTLRDDAFKEAIKITKKEKDDFDCFGDYVAFKLRNLKSDFYKGQLKSAIRKAIIQVSDVDEKTYWSGMPSYANFVIHRNLHNNCADLAKVQIKESEQRMRREKEHKMKMVILKKQEEEHKIKIEILKKELEIKTLQLKTNI